MERLLLVLAVLAFFVLCAGLMWLGYRGRRRRQAAELPDFPAVPTDFGPDELAPLAGVYVSTTTTASWQDRVARGDIGFRSPATLHLHADGLHVARDGAQGLWIPLASIEHARTAAGLAGKVMGTESLLVVRWTVDGTGFDTGLLADEPERYREWIDALGPATAKAGGTA